MSEPPTTSFVYRVESNRALLAAVRQMYDEATAEDQVAIIAAGWREQLSVLLARFGRALVLESLMEAVPELTLRQAMTLADLVERTPSDRLPAVTV